MFELVNQGLLLFIGLEATVLLPAWLLALLAWWLATRRRAEIAAEPRDGVAGAVARFRGRDAAWEERRARRYGLLLWALKLPLWRPVLLALAWLQPLLFIWIFIGAATLPADAWLNRQLERMPESASLPVGLALFFAPWVWALVFAWLSGIPRRLWGRPPAAFSGRPMVDAKARQDTAHGETVANIDEIEDALIDFLLVAALGTSCVVLPLLWYGLLGDPMAWLLED